MLNKIKKIKYIVAGGIGLAAVGSYIYYKKCKERREKFAKAFKLITIHQSEILASYLEGYISFAIGVIPPEFDRSMDRKTESFKDEKTINFIFKLLSQIEPAYTQKREQKKKMVCQRLGIDIIQYEKWRQKVLKKKPKSGEIGNLIKIRKCIFHSFFSGNYPINFLLQEKKIKIPEFLTGELRVKTERIKAETNLKLQFEKFFEFYEKNKDVVEKGGKLQLNQNLSQKLLLVSGEYVKKVMEFLTSEEYFGKDWDEKYEFHPILIYNASIGRFVGNKNGLESLLKMKECIIEIREKMSELVKDINLKSINDTMDKCQEIIRVKYDGAMEIIKNK